MFSLGAVSEILEVRFERLHRGPMQDRTDRLRLAEAADVIVRDREVAFWRHAGALERQEGVVLLQVFGMRHQVERTIGRAADIREELPLKCCTVDRPLADVVHARLDDVEHDLFDAEHHAFGV